MNTSGNGTQAPVRASAFGCITVPFVLIASVTLAWGARTQWANGELARNGHVVPGRVIELRFVASNPAVVESTRGGGRARGESPVVRNLVRRGGAASGDRVPSFRADAPSAAHAAKRRWTAPTSIP